MTINYDKKGSPYSIAERKVPELIPVLGSLQMTWVMNPAVGCHYLPPARSYPRNPWEGCYQFHCLVNKGMMGVNSLPKTVTWQHRGCDLNPGPSAPESSMLTIRLPSHLKMIKNNLNAIVNICGTVITLSHCVNYLLGWLLTHHEATAKYYARSRVCGPVFVPPCTYIHTHKII